MIGMLFFESKDITQSYYYHVEIKCKVEIHYVGGLRHVGEDCNIGESNHRCSVSDIYLNTINLLFIFIPLVGLY